VPGGSAGEFTPPTLIICDRWRERPRCVENNGVQRAAPRLGSGGGLPERPSAETSHPGLRRERGDSAADLEGVTRNINVWSEAGKFYLADTTKTNYNPAFNPSAIPTA